MGLAFRGMRLRCLLLVRNRIVKWTEGRTEDTDIYGFC